jgi:CheY-like chemotaxis protein
MNWDDLGNITLLVAEDDKFNRKLISIMLSKNNKIRIIEARDGKEALMLLDLKKMDALLLDIHMPNMNGFETLETIREHEVHKHLPVIVITSDEVEKNKSLSLGANAFLPKPFKLNELENQVYSVLVGA